MKWSYAPAPAKHTSSSRCRLRPARFWRSSTISSSETPSGISRDPSRRMDRGICSNNPSSDERPIAESISWISDSVCGANFTPGSLRAGRRSAGAILEAVLRHERQVVPLVEDLAPDLRVPLAELPHFPVLPGHQLLVERRDLDVEIELRQEEVGGESADDVSLAIPLDVERRGFVVPGDPVEVEQLRELALGGMGETDGVTLRQRLPHRCDRGLGSRTHDPAAAARRRLERVPSRSFHTWSRAIANTPWPFCRRSITASGECASYTPRPSDISVTPCAGRFMDFRCSTAFRTRCRDTPVSRSFLMTLSARRSWNEYSRWVPDPWAS